MERERSRGPDYALATRLLFSSCASNRFEGLQRLVGRLLMFGLSSRFILQLVASRCVWCRARGAVLRRCFYCSAARQGFSPRRQVCAMLTGMDAVCFRILVSFRTFGALWRRWLRVELDECPSSTRRAFMAPSPSVADRWRTVCAVLAEFCGCSVRAKSESDFCPPCHYL